MKNLFLIFLFIWSQLLAQSYKNPALPIQKRIDDLISKMTLEEKVGQLSGDGLRTLENKRLSIPGFEMSDGPIGVRTGKATAFPSGLAVASSWDTLLIGKVARAIAIESKGKGINLLLGPTVNIHRLPSGGRNFESYSEDPFLASRMAVNYIRAMQKEKVAVSLKHFCCNDQEWERMRVDAQIDEKTMHEIHLPMFKAAVQEAKAMTVMSAYNKINGTWASENKYLLTDILKKSWGFEGLVISDWEATHSTVPSAKAGLDLEMPNPVYFGDSLINAIKVGKILMSELDDKVRRVLGVKFRLGMFENKYIPNEKLVNTPEFQKLALESAQKGMILLKNSNNTLPLDKTKFKSIAIIGPNANIARTGAGGSSQIAPFYSVTPLEAIKNKVGNQTKVSFAQGDVIDLKGLTIIDKKYLVSETGEEGLTARYWDKATLQDALECNLTSEPTMIRIDKDMNMSWPDPASPDSKIDKDYWVTKWTGKLKPPISRKYTIFTRTDDGARVWFENKLVIDNWKVHGLEKDSFVVDMEGFKTYNIRIEYFEGNMGADFQLGWDLPKDGERTNNGTLLAEAVELAKNSDVAIVFAGMSNQYESEGFDTKTGLKLPSIQDSLISEIAKVNPRTIVCLTNGNVVEMPWLNQVSGVIEGWYSGQEVGNAFANILFGDFNPSGKLTRTFVNSKSDSPAYIGYKADDITAKYTEGIMVGYRYFDITKKPVLFPFGFGLSYSTYDYKNLFISDLGSKMKVTLTVKNTSKIAGEEIVQVYVKPKIEKTGRPVKELKGFSKVSLLPSEQKTVSIILNKYNAFSEYVVSAHDFVIQKGNYEILVGKSSVEIMLSKDVFVK
ncbi:MAG: beta-glucosidase [Cytophagales bacterium]|nr:MAG: beta-glucosidase [Cytophagales bacterium]